MTGVVVVVKGVVAMVVMVVVVVIVIAGGVGDCGWCDGGSGEMVIMDGGGGACMMDSLGDHSHTVTKHRLLQKCLKHPMHLSHTHTHTHTLQYIVTNNLSSPRPPSAPPTHPTPKTVRTASNLLPSPAESASAEAGAAATCGGDGDGGGDGGGGVSACDDGVAAKAETCVSPPPPPHSSLTHFIANLEEPILRLIPHLMVSHTTPRPHITTCPIITTRPHTTPSCRTQSGRDAGVPCLLRRVPVGQ